MKQHFLNHLKNIPGWRTRRKLVVLSVDDYGNVRLDSKYARENMDRAGLKVYNRFDAYDTLETREDLEMLYEVLSSVKDKNGRHAVFTPFALPCNIDFEQIHAENYQTYRYETLPATYEKLAAKDPTAFEGAWALWREGITQGLMAPQFHGREHLNLKVFEEKLQKRDPELMQALENRSYTSISGTGCKTIGYSAAFAFWSLEELQHFPAILEDGLDAFKRVFGYPATVFTPPAQQYHASLEQVLRKNGIKAIDRPLTQKRHLGYGKYKREINFTSPGKDGRTAIIVRNVVFEPTDDRGVDWVSFTLKQIAAAFRWNRPAIVSSHRVNFCGHIDPENRQKGLSSLKDLLGKIVQRWPEVEFISAGDLTREMLSEEHVSHY